MTPCEIIPLWGRDHLGIRGRHHSVTRGGIIQELGGGFLRNQHPVHRAKYRAAANRSSVIHVRQEQKMLDHKT
jgi:hypothetical protein